MSTLDKIVKGVGVLNLVAESVGSLRASADAERNATTALQLRVRALELELEELRALLSQPKATNAKKPTTKKAKR